MATMGRPTDFTQELADNICKQLGEGMSLRSVCLAGDMPDGSTVWRWLRIYPEFCKQYERAKAESADALVEKMLEITENAPLVITGKDNSDNARVSAEKLRVDTLKWISSKLKPKKYGDKLDLTSDGKALPTPIYGSKSTVK